MDICIKMGVGGGERERKRGRKQEFTAGSLSYVSRDLGLFLFSVLLFSLSQSGHFLNRTKAKTFRLQIIAFPYLGECIFVCFAY